MASDIGSSDVSRICSVSCVSCVSGIPQAISAINSNVIIAAFFILKASEGGYLSFVVVLSIAREY